MWLGYVLYVMFITRDNTLVAYNIGHYNLKQECTAAKEEIMEALDDEAFIKRYYITCKENKQDFNEYIQSIKGE